jgi:hypothetical protein
MSKNSNFLAQQIFFIYAILFIATIGFVFAYVLAITKSIDENKNKTNYIESRKIKLYNKF